MNIIRSVGMLQKINQFLKQPFPSLQNQWQFVVIVTVCVFAILNIISYFIVDHTSLRAFARFVGLHTVIVAICTSIVVYLFPALFKHSSDEKRWTKGKYLAFALILILMFWIGAALYDCVFYELSFIKSLSDNILITFMVGIIPITFGYFWLKNRGLDSDLQEKENQTEDLFFRLQKNDTTDKRIITLSGNTKDTLTLFPQELLYLEASDNYVQVHYKVNDHILQKTFRVTLQQMEEHLSDYPFFVRCHRAFIVNIYQIEKMKGFKLWLKSLKTEIPISKTCKANLQKQMKIIDYSPQN